MTVERDTATAAETPVLRAPLARRWVGGLVHFARRKPLGAMGGSVILLLVVLATTAPLVAPYNPEENNYKALRMAPSVQHLMGTDQFGRDILSRVIYGARVSLYVGLGAVLLGTTTGSLIGLVGSYFGGRTDLIIQRVMDALLAFPTLVLALAVIAAVGSSLNNVVIAISLSILPSAARVIRSRALGIKESEYITAARAVGSGNPRIILRHMLPNCAAPYIIIASVALGGAILSESSLSFLGLGPPPPAPTWGSMLSGAAETYARTAPWIAVFPGLAITFTVFGFNLLGDALRDVLDPRLRGTR